MISTLKACSLADLAAGVGPLLGKANDKAIVALVFGGAKSTAGGGTSPLLRELVAATAELPVNYDMNGPDGACGLAWMIGLKSGTGIGALPVIAKPSL